MCCEGGGAEVVQIIILFAHVVNVSVASGEKERLEMAVQGVRKAFEHTIEQACLSSKSPVGRPLTLSHSSMLSCPC